MGHHNDAFLASETDQGTYVRPVETDKAWLISEADYGRIIDGVIGSIGYPDERTTTVSGHDCRWVTNAMGSLDGTALALSAAQRQAIWGFAPATLPGLPFTCFGYQFFDGVDYLVKRSFDFVVALLLAGPAAGAGRPGGAPADRLRRGHRGGPSEASRIPPPL